MDILYADVCFRFICFIFGHCILFLGNGGLNKILYYNSPYICLSVGVSKLQVAIIARSCREMTQTVRIE